MRINFYRSCTERKALVTAIGDILGIKPKYKGAPTFIYQIGDFEIDKEGGLIFEEDVVGAKAATLLVDLEEQGFAYEKLESPAQSEISGGDLLVIEVPKKGFTETAFTNLNKILESKGGLIKKALSVNALPIEETEDTLRFPWFQHESDPDKVNAYIHLISAICKMARTQKRITATAKGVDNEKYAFRCFLLRLGFIGSEYKTVRKILLSKLTGSSAFKSSTAKHEEAGQQ
ncbi:hypothetical protein EDD66_10553 [Mobilisporobacter senegalensis]|uniref:Virulence-related protein n=1 Tax=Mobilisporobacter senegalensis TaxID=1329262 RepID=A0A3N1XN55_9FIRM|nr:virulence protein [Mobilisporobacter senegalensis]ROR28115.1 hypothetical protein EDD66_10553 [Mobilisporobacter senegalensis]